MVMVVIIILAAFGFPALQQMFTRSKLQGSAREITVHLGSSRVAAMRMSRNVVVKPLFSEKRLVSFVDDNEQLRPGHRRAGALQPGAPRHRRRPHLPDGSRRRRRHRRRPRPGARRLHHHRRPAIPTFPTSTSRSSSPTARSAIRAAFRISDGKNPANVFEVRIEPPATARVEILKYVYDDVRRQQPGHRPGRELVRAGRQHVGMVLREVHAHVPQPPPRRHARRRSLGLLADRGDDRDGCSPDCS